MSVLLISTYEMGRQPFGLASPTAFLREAGFNVACLDLSVQRLDRGVIERADLVAFYLPMHTAARIAQQALDKVVEWNPDAHLCSYGLYARASAEVMRRRGVRTILSGEFEEGLVRLARRICAPGQEVCDSGHHGWSCQVLFWRRCLRQTAKAVSAMKNASAGNRT